MTILGNIILFFAAILFFALQFILFGITNNRSSDALMGYAWVSVLLNLAFLVCLVIATFIIGYTGGFDWISPRRSVRLPIIAFVLMTAMGVSLFGSVFRFETARMPAFLKIITRVSPVIIPLVLLLASAILLNTNLRSSVSENLYKWPLIGVAVFGSFGIASIVYEYLCELNRSNRVAEKSFVEDERLNYQRKLKEIDSCDVTKDMVYILVFTDFYQPFEIKTKAVEKIKSNPEWEHRLIDLLNSDWAPQAFTFLGSHDVDHPRIFHQPVKNGIIRQAAIIRHTINIARGPYDLRDDVFSWELERLVLAVDRLKSEKVEFRPEMLQLLKALREPSPYRPREFAAERAIRRWLGQ